jgi:hypothetical protein
MIPLDTRRSKHIRPPFCDQVRNHKDDHNAGIAGNLASSAHIRVKRRSAYCSAADMVCSGFRFRR